MSWRVCGPIVRPAAHHQEQLPPPHAAQQFPEVGRSGLDPGLGYSGLDIQEGSAASASYARMIAEDTTQEERVGSREALLAYCRMDTEALVRVLTALRHLA